MRGCWGDQGSLQIVPRIAPAQDYKHVIPLCVGCKPGFLQFIPCRDNGMPPTHSHKELS